MTDFVLSAMSPAIDIGSGPDLENQDVVVVNPPCYLTLTTMPFSRAYHGQVLPKSLRALAPGANDLEILRTDENTIVLKTKTGNFFSCDQESPLHFAYLFKMLNIFRDDRFGFNIGDKVVLLRLIAEVINVDEQSQPTEVSFRFAVPLDDPSLHWLRFNWTNGSYSSFQVPPLGQKVEIPGPPSVTLKDSISFITNILRKK
jgi:hypothetical protein